MKFRLAENGKIETKKENIIDVLFYLCVIPLSLIGILIFSLFEYKQIHITFGSLFSLYVWIFFSCMSCIHIYVITNYCLRVKSVKLSYEGLTVKYQSGYDDFYEWEKLRSIDLVFGFIVFSDNNYINFLVIDKKSLDFLNKLSNGITCQRERRRLTNLFFNSE